jgi:hypothetical protein
MEKKLEQISRGLELVLRQINIVSAMLDDLVKDMQKLRKVVAREPDVLKFIYDMDRRGINMHRIVLMNRLGHINNIDKLYFNLLKAGEIFEIQGIVYPLETKNDVKN